MIMLDRKTCVYHLNLMSDMLAEVRIPLSMVQLGATVGTTVWVDVPCSGHTSNAKLMRVHPYAELPIQYIQFRYAQRGNGRTEELERYIICLSCTHYFTHARVFMTQSVEASWGSLGKQSFPRLPHIPRTNRMIGS